MRNARAHLYSNISPYTIRNTLIDTIATPYYQPKRKLKNWRKRSIGVLEGIALVADKNFAIIDEAFPYIAKRLLTDPNPRLRKDLKYMIYGKEGVFNAEEFVDLLRALQVFEDIRNTDPKGFRDGRSETDAQRVKYEKEKESVRSALRFFFAEEGSFFRELVGREWSSRRVFKASTCN